MNKGTNKCMCNCVCERERERTREGARGGWVVIAQNKRDNEKCKEYILSGVNADKKGGSADYGNLQLYFTEICL